MAYPWAAEERLDNDDLNDAIEQARQGLFGDASDGDVTISGNTTLTRDMYYNNLTINTGVVLTTAGYRVFVKDTLTTNGTGAIRWNGNPGGDGGVGPNGQGGTSSGGTAGTAASALADAMMGGAVAGKAGGAGGSGGFGDGDSGINGTAGNAQTACVDTTNGSAGGNGGIGGKGEGADDGGSAGNGQAGGNTTASLSKPRSITNAVLAVEMSAAATPVFYKSTAGPGSGGGGGGGD